MSLSEDDRRILDALAAARDQHEDLADLLDFYYDLYKLQFEAKADLPEPEVRDQQAMCWRLEGGIPQLTFDQLRIEPEPFALLVGQVTGILRRHNPGWQIDLDAWTALEFVHLAQNAFEKWDTLAVPAKYGDLSGLDSGSRLVAMAVGLAMAAYLYRAAEAIRPHLDLALWSQKYCPVCGGRPNLALLEEGTGARKLVCSKCASLWSYRRLPCPFCDTREHPIYHVSEDRVYRLYVCPSCNHYLKTVDLREVHRVIHPMVERLLTIGMDLAAQQEGWAGG